MFGYIILLYLGFTFFIGCIAMLISTSANESIGIFFNPKEWPSVDDDNSVIFALFCGYIFMFSFSILYWIYKVLRHKRP